MSRSLAAAASLAAWRLASGAAGAAARARRWLPLPPSRAGGAKDIDERLALDLDPVPGRTGGIWLHGASVGEVRSLAPLIAEFERLAPGRARLLTTSSVTGREAARRMVPSARLGPWDSAAAVERFLRATEPSLHVVVETEIWPVRLRALAEREVPVALVSARLSPRRWPRYRRLRPLYSEALKTLALLGPASPQDRRRFLELGADPGIIRCEGHLKWDAALDPGAPDKGLPMTLGLDPAREWVVLGSVHPGECGELVRALLAGRPKRLGLIVAPRHPERFDQIEQELREAGQTPHRSTGGPAGAGARVILVDQLGVLPRLYRVAAAAFVGGTLVPVGGHSPLEAAAAGCPLVAGPRCEQQEVLVGPLEQAGALRRVADSAGAAAALLRLIDDRELRRTAGEAARAVVEQRRGLAPRLARELLELIP